MRQLIPAPTDVDPVSAHAEAARPAPDGRPWILYNMVSSTDGATAVDGVSGGLGGPGDKEVFRAIRGAVDVIVVAAGTVRAEAYGPPRTAEPLRAARVARGQTPYPRIAVVTGSLDLDPTTSMFTEAPEPPLIFTPSQAPADRRARLVDVAEVRDVDGADGRVDLHQVFAHLAALGYATALVEGGPGLNGQLVAEGLIDELNLTLAPLVIGGSSRRVSTGGDERLHRMELRHLWEHEGALFARYVTETSSR